METSPGNSPRERRADNETWVIQVYCRQGNVGVLPCGSKPMWPQLNFGEWWAFPSCMYILLSSVSEGIPTDPTRWYVIRAAFLASTGQHVLLLFMVVVLLFLSKRVSITVPSAIPPTSAPTASRPKQASWVSIYASCTHLQHVPPLPICALADTIGLDPGRRKAQEGTQYAMGLIWKFLRSDAVKALASDFNGSRLALTPSTLP